MSSTRINGAKAAANAEAMVGLTGWGDRCLAAVNKQWEYSIPYLSAPTAYSAYLACPKSELHPMTETPTVGAHIFYKTGHPAGHIDTVVEGGNVVSNDIVTFGTMSKVPMSDVTNGRWRLTALGWANPDGSATASTGSGTADSSGSSSGGGDSSNPITQLTSALKWITDPSTPKRIGEIIIGIALVTLALVRMT